MLCRPRANKHRQGKCQHRLLPPSKRRCYGIATAKTMYINPGVGGRDEAIQTAACDSKDEMRRKEDGEKWPDDRFGSLFSPGASGSLLR